MRKIDPSWILQGSSRGDIPNVTPPILLPHQNANQYIAALYYSNQISAAAAGWRYFICWAGLVVVVLLCIG